MIKIDVKDKKILSLLDENARYTNSQIAKRVHLSKPAVEYRIQGLVKKGAIFSHYTVINFTKLGYSQYKIYFKFQNTSMDEEKKMINYWINDKNSIWVGEMRGRWDLAVSVLSKSNFEFGRILGKFMNHFSKFILEKDILLTEYSPVYSREYLAQGKERKKFEFIYGVPERIYELDEIDRRILKEISNNTRATIIEISGKLNLSRDVINYRMKKLLKDKIIIQFRTFPNLENLGIKFYKIIVRTKNFNETEEEKMKDYVRNNKKVTQLLKLIGSWDLELEIESENEDELYGIISDIRKNFSEVIRDFDILRITKTHKYNYFPF